MKESKKKVERRTNETDIKVELNLNGSGKTDIETGIPFFNHMLEQIGRHGFMDLTIQAKGDIEIDFHHTVEDTGICLGQALNEALGDRTGIKRFGTANIPLCEALSSVTVDLCSRPFLVFNVKLDGKVGDFDTELVAEFFHAFVANADITLHVNNLYGSNAHHLIETVFKGVGKAISLALEEETRGGSALSTKGVL